MSEAAARARVAEIAKTWLRTPYHSHGRSKGAGVDCAMLVAEVYQEAGVIARVEPEHYPPDWHLHRSGERYIDEVLKRARELEAGELPRPGDLLLVQFGRTYSHGAIVLDWPLCIHAMMGQPTGYVDAELDGMFKKETGALRPFKFFSLWPKAG